MACGQVKSTKSALLGSAKMPTAAENQGHNCSADSAAPPSVQNYAAKLASKQATDKPKSSTEPTKSRRASPNAARAPPVPAFGFDELPAAAKRTAYTINEFCQAHGISPAMYYKLKAQGLGPLEMKVGSRRLISFEAAAAWRRAREAASV
jgi:hypothetical protein